MTRRTALFLIQILSCSLICLAQQQPVTVQKIRGNIYMIKGGNGANCGAYINEKEVVVIDAKTTADSAKQMIEEIRKLTPNPITRIILTHSDGDHVNGLNGFPTGLKIYGHPRTKQDMETAAKAPNTQYLRDYLPNEACPPCETAKEGSMIVKMGNQQIWLTFFGPAHTSGDFVVFFPPEKVAFIGDLAFIGRDPLIHRQKGGTFLGTLATLKSLIALDADTYISGHNDPLTKKDLQGLYDSLSEKRDRVKTMIEGGKSLEDVKKAFGVQEGSRFPSLAESIYLDLTKK